MAIDPCARVARRSLITQLLSGSGRIGTLVAANLKHRYALNLLDRQPPADPNLPFICADISQTDALAGHFNGIDTVLHLAADPRPTALWTSLFPNNVIGTYHVVQAACAAGCRRIVFASSLHAVLGYPRDVYVHSDMPPRPATLYGATKAWGESLAREYAAAAGISILCVRIGYLVPPASPVITPGHPHLNLVLTHRDLVGILTACIKAPDSLRFGIFHAVSQRPSRRFDMSAAEHLLGFTPQDDANALAWRNVHGMARRLHRGALRRLHAIQQRCR